MKKSLGSSPAVAVGDEVIAKNRNGRYYHCTVTSFNETVYYKVAFQDGSFSNDMLAEDIQVSVGISVLNRKELERPPPNATKLSA